MPNSNDGSSSRHGNNDPPHATPAHQHVTVLTVNDGDAIHASGKYDGAASVAGHQHDGNAAASNAINDAQHEQLRIPTGLPGNAISARSGAAGSDSNNNGKNGNNIDTSPSPRPPALFDLRTRHALQFQTLCNTTLACIVAAIITYPAEVSRMQWEWKELRDWDPVQRRRNLRIVTPLTRLTTNEWMGAMMGNAVDDACRNDILAGAAAGCCQAVLLAPAELYYAHQHMHWEQGAYSTWRVWMRSHLLQGGTVDPTERRARAFRGVGVIAAREMVFNVTFFPLFHFLRQQLLQYPIRQQLRLGNPPGDSSAFDAAAPQTYHLNSLAGSSSPQQQHPQRHDQQQQKPSNAFATFGAGIAAGMLCSLAVTPMDMLKTYMMYSRERWSLWSGRKLHAPPLATLARGLTFQAFCFGPSFGIVAAIHELA